MDLPKNHIGSIKVAMHIILEWLKRYFNQRRHYKLTGDAVGGANTTGESVMGGRVIGVLEGRLLGLDDGEPGVAVGDAVMVTKPESTSSLLGLITALMTPS